MKKVDKLVLASCMEICLGDLSGHKANRRELCSQDCMNFIEPIRDRKKIAQIKNLLRGQKRYLGSTDDELEAVAQRLNL